ncbi:hypothetical protein O6H91_13G004000 [Diphasiastrum complanatum]|nr:hypothetical protein O6H91_13G004000 [Diphasiastrum complanatum]KAJ7532454.1 hypothetical protein O6H91_13G004000 [Diphasiastrum complanatum]KAJ7532455.1 hypothetical protein O6H91_13G004000 [Diphasiastrum complanatum]
MEDDLASSIASLSISHQMCCHPLMLPLLMAVTCAISRYHASAHRLLSERSSAVAQHLDTRSTDIKLQLAISHVEAPEWLTRPDFLRIITCLMEFYLA